VRGETAHVNNKRGRANSNRKIPGRADRRRSGPFGRHRPKPTAAATGLARWKAPAMASPKGAVVAGTTRSHCRVLESMRVGARSSRAHRATESVRSSLVRSGFPQPMGAGGRRPPWIPNRGLRAAPVRSVSKLAGLKAVLFDEGITAARTVRPFDENRRRTTMPRCAASAARRFAVAERPPHGRHRDAQSTGMERHRG